MNAPLIVLKNYLDRIDAPYSEYTLIDLMKQNQARKHALNLDVLSKFETYDEKSGTATFEVEKTEVGNAQIRGCLYNIDMKYPSTCDSILLTKLRYNSEFITPLMNDELRHALVRGGVELGKNDCTVGSKLSRIIRREIDKTNKAIMELWSSEENASPMSLERFIKVDAPYIERQFILLSDLLSEKKSTETWTISTSLYDFLRMSYGNSWDSCHAYQHDYSGGCIEYALNRNNLILYRENSEGKLISRAVVYTKDNAIIIGRQYGSQFTKRDVAKGIALAMGIEHYTINEESIENDFTGLNYGYPDHHYHNGIVLESDSIVIETENKLKGDAKCLQCGEEIDDGSKWYCDCCDGSKRACEVCGDMHDDDDLRWVEGVGNVCEGCSSYCRECNEYHLDSDFVTVRNSQGREREICTSCAERGDYRTCDHCGELVHVDLSFYIDSTDKTACESCHDELYTMCNKCDESVLIEDIDGETGYCQYCHAEYELETRDSDTIDEVTIA